MFKGSVLFLALSAGAVMAEDASSGLPASVIDLWAKNALPLADFVAAGYGMAEPSDATSAEWCAYQANTISLMYADSDACRDMINRMIELGRITE